MSHTKTPWQIKTCVAIPDEDSGWFDLSGEGIKNVATCRYGIGGFDEAAANAAFIVQAVNSHALLVGALEDVDALIGTHDERKFAAARRHIQQCVRTALATVTTHKEAT